MTGELATNIAVIFVALAIGGIMKGATGAGAPLLAVPAMATFRDVSFAIAIMLVPNIVTNIWQAWRYREYLPSGRWLPLFVIGGMAGAIGGTWLLTELASDTLMAMLGTIVTLYIALRLFHPHFVLPERTSSAVAGPVGLASGVLQGATGISAPISITYLNAMRLRRPVFIFTIALLFATFSLVQLVALSFTDILTPERMTLSVLAIAPVTLAMPLGNWLGRKLPDHAFDRAILVLLAVLAARLFYDAIT